jgi:hypothetical protein
MKFEKILLVNAAYPRSEAPVPQGKLGVWPCKWIAATGTGEPPFVAAYRLKFQIDEPAMVRLHVTADERYELFVDGQRIGRGSERGDAEHWRFETYDIDFDAGEHVLVARVWSLGSQAPYAQMSVSHGLLLSPQEKRFIDLLGTGVAKWEAKRLGGYAFTDPMAAWGTGANLAIDGSAFDWGFERGEGEGWTPVEDRHPGYDTDTDADLPPLHRLAPATLPAMMDRVAAPGLVRFISDLPEEPDACKIPIRDEDHLIAEMKPWSNLLAGVSPITIPPHTRRRVVIDLQNYYCAYPQIVTSGGLGAKIRLDWQESLFDDLTAKTKGNRDQIEGKYFTTHWWQKDGIGDLFKPDGGENRVFETLWWQCGRYVQVMVHTADQRLVIDHLVLHETRYPLESASNFWASDPRLGQFFPIAMRSLQMCSHETYMDCPYYEQLQYVGDTRLEALITYAITNDDRLPRQGLRTFDFSRLNNGLTQSRYPSRVRQVIPPFSLWWVAMVHDYAMWRNDPEFVRERMPGVRGVLESFRQHVDHRGLLGPTPGWNFGDWVKAWTNGVPPDGRNGFSGVLNWQFALVMHKAAELEEFAGEMELARRNRALASRIGESMNELFWSEALGLYADDLSQQSFSEHSQSLALLSGLVPAERRESVIEGLIDAEASPHGLHRATVYFSHYVLEALHSVGRGDELVRRIAGWFGHLQMGMKTTLEMPEPGRSDCHAWGAHPIYHYFASILGIRPASRGFASVLIAPQLGSLESAEGEMVHPAGIIWVRVRREEKGLRARITLPHDLQGEFRFGSHTSQLRGGEQEILAR